MWVSGCLSGTSVWHLRLRGEHDLSNAAELREALRELQTLMPVVVDLGDVVFMDSSIVGVLIAAWEARTEPGRHTIVLMSPLRDEPARLLSLIGLADQIPTFWRFAEAKAAVLAAASTTSS
jgi:anti-anti-sigma factor